jgi:hypothetical protein
MQTTPPTQTAIAPTPSNGSTQTLKTADLVGILLLTIPLLGLLSVISYRQYRARLIKHQMAALERIWKLNSIEKTP